MATHEIVHITKHGRPAVALLAEEDLESLHETIFWLSQPHVRESIDQADQEAAAESTTSGDDLRAEFGLSR